MMDVINMDKVKAAFDIRCKKCGSDNVVMNIEGGFAGSDVTAADPDDFTMGCNACKANDLFFSGYGD